MSSQIFMIVTLVLLSLVFILLVLNNIAKIYNIFFKRNFFTKLGSSAQIRLIHELNEACTEMSRRQIGALITIERKNHLDLLRTDGIILNASISSDIILAIFEKGSPLHDGALIIRNNTILYAGTFYKITQSSVSNRFGARHRAAIGIAEQSDALTIIISEETGDVSFTHHGRIFNVKTNNFQEKLLECLQK